MSVALIDLGNHHMQESLNQSERKFQLEGYFVDVECLGSNQWSRIDSARLALFR